MSPAAPVMRTSGAIRKDAFLARQLPIPDPVRLIGFLAQPPLPIRFVLAVVLLTLIASSFTVPYLLTKLPPATALKIAVLPPVSFLGLARTVWLNGTDSFAASVSKAALSALALAILIALLAYALSFRLRLTAA